MPTWRARLAVQHERGVVFRMICQYYGWVVMERGLGYIRYPNRRAMWPYVVTEPRGISCTAS